MPKNDIAAEVATISARCMRAELDAKRQCIEDLLDLEPETEAEKKLKSDILDKLMPAANHLEAQLRITEMMADVLGRAAAAQAAKAGEVR